MRLRYIEHTVKGKDFITIHHMRNDGKAFCSLTFFDDDKTYGVLESLSVHESVRNKGVATKLMELCENTCRKRGCKQSWLYVDKSTWMREWYKRRGYAYGGKYKQLENNIWLKKEL